MTDPNTELRAFMAECEQATNTHDINQVTPMICTDTTYGFSDGSHHGPIEITAAIEKTFTTIVNST